VSTVAVLAIVASVAALPAPSASVTDVVPTQWIAKQYTELLGRAPADDEWADALRSFEREARCAPVPLAEMARRIAESPEFAANYPEVTPFDRSARFTAVIRATLSRDPTADDWSRWFVDYRDGAAGWSEFLDGVYRSSAFARLAHAEVCDAAEPGYGFGTPRYAPPLDLYAVTGDEISRSQTQLQEQLDAVAASGGGIVELQPGEVIRVGGSDNGDRSLVVPAGVSLSTVGNPGPGAYARMGRIVPDGPDAAFCHAAICSNTALVNVATGGSVSSVWVEAAGLEPHAYKVAGIETGGSTDAAPTRVTRNRVSAPARDGVGIRARGFSVYGVPCTSEVVSENLVTAYASVQSFDSMGRARWADGIAVGCESAQVTDNDLVDISDAAIVVYGSYSVALGETHAQTSTVSGNRVLSAGVPGHIALGFDAIGECLQLPPGGLVPCLDVPELRDFGGATITRNTYWTGPRTHFDIGLMVGGAPRWGDHRVPASGATATDNTTAPNGARVNMGIAVLGMADAVLANNTGPIATIDGNRRSEWGKCPQFEFGVGTDELATASIMSMASPANADGADGCLLGEPSAGGLELLTVDPSGSHLVAVPSGERFTAWGMRTPADMPETFWNEDWDRLVDAFREIRRMGANIVRFNIQFATFVGPPTDGYPDGTPNAENLARLRDVVDLAEQTGLYIELSGLRVQRDYDSGDWYSTRDEAARWRSQAVFWTAVAGELADSDAVAWYDLMNEPMVPTEPKTTWCRSNLGPDCYVQFLTKDPAGRDSVEIFRTWMTQMRDAIRRQAGDTRHMITVAGLPYGNSGFRPSDLDGLEEIAAVHLYPTAEDGLEKALRDAAVAKADGQPLILDETGPWGGGDVAGFILGTKDIAAGWIGHYLEQTPAEIVAKPDAPLAELWHLGSYATFRRLTLAMNPDDGGIVQP
jgi:hypothetical protein